MIAKPINQKSLSLAEILDNCKSYPLSFSDLRRLKDEYKIEIDFRKNNHEAVMYIDNEEYWFIRGYDLLYYLKDD